MGVILNAMVRNGSTIAIPGVPALETFLAVAKHGSFRKAALERGVSPSALSHVIRTLESTLDVRLFNRTNRSVRITAAGEYLMRRIGPALGDIAEAIEQINTFRGRVAGTLRLNVPRAAADLIFKPILGRFLVTYPDVRLEIVSDDRPVDIVAEGFDAGIRPGRRLAKDMIAVPIGLPRRYAVVGAPSYFEAKPKPRTPQDLHLHRCVSRRYPSGNQQPWEFARGADAVAIEVSGPLVVDDSAYMVQAALAGVGLGRVYECLVADHVANGELVRVLEEWCPKLPHYYLYYPGRRQIPAPLRAFIDMMRTSNGFTQS